MHILW